MTTSTIDRELLEQALGQLICNTNNMQKGMSKSIQKLCARENAEVLERLRAALAAPATAPERKPEFQSRTAHWLMACFGPTISSDKTERNHRFLEESLELVQAAGCSKSEAVQLVDYVFNRPVGEPHQEVGGVMVTLAALCLTHGMDMHDAGDVELARIWTKMDQIRAKQAEKPKYGPLPQARLERKPMTDKDIAGAIVRSPDPMAFGKLPAEGWRPMVRLVEAFHGIKEDKP